MSDTGGAALLIALLFAPASITMAIALIRGYRITITMERPGIRRVRDEDD